MTEHSLLDAVDALTEHTITRHIQTGYKTVLENGRPQLDDNGNVIRKLVTEKTPVHHEPLLDLLEAAIRGAMNATAGSSESLKFARGMLDSDALYHFTRISTQINDWSRIVGAPKRPTAREQLRAWYVAYAAQEREEAHVRAHIRTLTSWATLIEEKADPHDEYIQPDRCPNPDCPQGTDPLTGRPIWWDPRTKEAYTDPLVVTFRRTDGPEMINNARARCRACGTQWSVRGLQWAIEHDLSPARAPRPKRADGKEVTPV